MTREELLAELKRLSDKWEAECWDGWGAKEDAVETIRILLEREKA